MLRHRGWPTMQYLARTEAHTYAFSVAANAILSFFPFMVLLMWLIRNVFHSATMSNVVVDLLKDHLPAGQDFVIHNLQSLVKDAPTGQDGFTGDFAHYIHRRFCAAGSGF